MDAYLRQYNHIAGDILQYYAEEQKDSNLVLSPYSILSLLLVAAYSTNGKTSEEIKQYVSGNTSSEAFRTWMKEAEKVLEEGSLLHSADAVCVNKKAESSITDGYREKIQELFDAELFSSQDFVTAVNEWVKEHTNGMIKEIADDSMRDMMFCLMNAIAFDAKWDQEYEEHDVHEEPFENIDYTESEVQMLHSKETEYLENEYFTGAVKPYKGNRYVFLGLLPKETGNDYLRKALNETDLSALYENRQDGLDVNLTLPEFTASSSSDISAYCKTAGINTVFSDQADFSPLSSLSLKADLILHKARIEVNRQGTKAAAVTAMMLRCTGALDFSRIRNVELTRPFVYAILERETELPVFIGIQQQF